MPNDTTFVMSPLERQITQLIARLDNVLPEDVTIEYIRLRRDESVYPTAKYAIGSDYGGYNIDGLESLTLVELEELEESVDKELAKF